MLLSQLVFQQCRRQWSITFPACQLSLHHTPALFPMYIWCIATLGNNVSCAFQTSTCYFHSNTIQNFYLNLSFLFMGKIVLFYTNTCTFHVDFKQKQDLDIPVPKSLFYMGSLMYMYLWQCFRCVHDTPSLGIVALSFLAIWRAFSSLKPLYTLLGQYNILTLL